MKNKYIYIDQFGKAMELSIDDIEKYIKNMQVGDNGIRIDMTKDNMIFIKL